MKNPFLDIDGRRKFFINRGQDFFLKVATSAKTLCESKGAVDLLTELATASERELEKELVKRGEHLVKLHEKEELWTPTPLWLATSFENESNRTAFIIENEKSEACCIVIALINCPHAREKMKVSDEVGTFIYLTHCVSKEEMRGTGMLSLVVNKINSMIKNPKRELPEPIDYSISVSLAPAINEATGELTNYVMNLPRYARMWQNRFESNKLQHRFQKDPSNQEGRERLPLTDFLDSRGDLDEKKLSEEIERKKPEAAAESKIVRGMFLEGRHVESYFQSVIRRREAQGIVR